MENPIPIYRHLNEANHLSDFDFFLLHKNAYTVVFCSYPKGGVMIVPSKRLHDCCVPICRTSRMDVIMLLKKELAYYKQRLEHENCIHSIYPNFRIGDSLTVYEPLEDIITYIERYMDALLEIEAEIMYKIRCAIKIQRAYVKAYYDPSHVICKSRLQHEYKKLTNLYEKN
jgi:hypothetical protein